MKKRALVWLRRDLRLYDHSALEWAETNFDEVIVAFVSDTNILSLLPSSDTRVTFIYDSLREIHDELTRRGSQLVVLHGDPLVEIPNLARTLKVTEVVTARDFEPYAIQRDVAVSLNLGELSIRLHHVLDHVVQAGDTVFNQSGAPFRVFTPFSKAWRSQLTREMVRERQVTLNKFVSQAELETFGEFPSLAELGFEGKRPWLEPGTTAARNRLDRFIPIINNYAEERDRPDLEATSTLSVDLRFGTISVRDCFRRAQESGGLKWETELIWREFYSMILLQFPHVVTETFQPQYRDLEWPGTPSDYKAWEEGMTGFPIVDAAMRCLNSTGWMHNRLRMVVASFLTKDLLVDYRQGEAYFALKLLDFDLASNNGGWQWASSMGADSQPYFRIFNPVLQSRKFDPKGDFIRKWCPELKDFDPDLIHWPHDATAFDQAAAGCILGEDYPHPIVDHAKQKELATRLLTVEK